MLKILSFGLLAVITLYLAVASVLDLPYTSWPVATAWGVMAAASAAYIVKTRLYRRMAMFIIHVSFTVILLGAAVTHFTGKERTVHLRLGEDEAIDDMRLTLVDFEIENYPGTSTPRDFISRVAAGSDTITVSMNNVGHIAGMTLTQQSFDSDGKSVTFNTVSDSPGIAITHTGYVLLALSLLTFFFTPGSQFRRAVKALAIAGILAGVPTQASAADSVSTLPDSLLQHLRHIPVEHNGRICPFSTLSRDFLMNVYGSDTYRGATHMQVSAGMLFYFDTWRTQPIIKIKNTQLRDILGLDGSRHASYDQLSNALAIGTVDRNDSRFTDDLGRLAAIDMMVSGRLLKMFPIPDGDTGNVEWHSPVDDFSYDTDNDKWLFTRKFFGLVNESVQTRDYASAVTYLDKLQKYQLAEAPQAIPSHTRLKVEDFYYRAGNMLMPTIVSLVAGLLIMILSRRGRWLASGALVVNIGLFAWISLLMAMRWYITGHVPLSNGFETMQFMAWTALAAGLVTLRRHILLMSFSLIVAAMAMAVAAMSGNGNSIGTLMPVLRSPLLSVHVMTVMMSYTLFALMMLNSVAALTFGRHESPRAAVLNRVMLTPAVALLAAGIFIGAVWANVSWGRYWGWDPKEVWALITMLIYAFPLHGISLPWFRRDNNFHTYCIVAFLSVIITYFGVNYLLGGMHAYM